MRTLTEAAGLVELSHASGLDLAAYRPDHVEQRIELALEAEQVATLAELLDQVRADEAARERFRTAVAVAVTTLFRDRHQFELLERELLPGVVANRARVRAWSAGCADGAELYALALLLERAGRLEGSYLLGSDVLVDRVAAALVGRYGDVEIAPEIRAHTRFEQRDLVRDPMPPGLFDLVLCREVCMYLAPAAEQRLHARLADALAPGGVLMLGRSERIADPAALGLEPAGPQAYRRAGS